MSEWPEWQPEFHERIVIMPGHNHNGGICRTCRFGTDCTLADAASQTVLQCEQFEMSAPPPARATSRRSGALSQPPAAEDPGANGLLGLCRTCADRDGCTFVRPESGVWHCEEYQ